MVAYIKSDLEFILEQIKIAEAHAAGQPLFGAGGLVPAYNLSMGLRTVDGTYNHLLPGQEKWGAADSQFPTLLDPAYRPADGTLFDPDGPGPAPAMPTAPNYNPVEQSRFARLRFEPAHDFQPARRPDAGQSGSHPDRAGARRLGQPDGRSCLRSPPSTQTFKPASDAEYQARVVDAERQGGRRGSLATATPTRCPAQAEQAAIDAWTAATAAHADTVTALEAARVVRDAALEPFGIAMDGDNVHLPAVAPDEGLSAPFNSWFTLFGQFFDHGLDLVNKGGSGTVFIPLQPDDPLYVDGQPHQLHGADPRHGLGGHRRHHGHGRRRPAGQHHDRLRRPEPDLHLAFVAPGVPAPVRAERGRRSGRHRQADRGRQWRHGDLGRGQGPGRVDARHPADRQRRRQRAAAADRSVRQLHSRRRTAMPQLITGIGADGIPNTADDIVVAGTTWPPRSPRLGAIRTGHAFLADIAHEAVPVGKIADGDITIGLANPGNGDAEYDNELLDAHFIAGDGRVNENIGLTAVHHVFHAEHNRLVEHTKDVCPRHQRPRLHQRMARESTLALCRPLRRQVAALVWDGERLFQAAKFGTEMQYQHLVFEEFARKIQPNINVFLVPDGFDTTINPSIVAEFAHVVYRFGHSMLTESIDRFDPAFTPDHIGLIEGFLNPVAFDGADRRLRSPTTSPPAPSSAA